MNSSEKDSWPVSSLLAFCKASLEIDIFARLALLDTRVGNVVV